VTLNQFLFKNRSYTPIPWVIAMLVFAHPTVWSMIGGFALACCGEFLRAWGVFYVGSETRVTGAVGASRLMTSGPFSRTRNPLYIGNMLIYLGIGIMSWALVPWLQIAAMAWFLFQYTMIVLEEERFLRKEFGEAYEQYVKAVPRFGIALRRYESPKAFTIDWRGGWASEARSIQAFVFAASLVLVMWFVR
jgi:protein-S-isoprenylcysteine O-methyltransferase Ste14